MSCKYVIGSGATLDHALAAWRECDPQANLQAVPVDPNIGRLALEAILDALALEGASAFVAIGPEHLNFRRLAVVDALRRRGLPMPPLLSRSALVADGAAIGENCWIGPGAIVQHGCSIGDNVVIGAGAILGAGASVGASCWIDDGVVAGRDAKLGAHVTLGIGVFVAHGVRIADQCVIDRPGRVEANVTGKTFLHASHDGPIVVAGA